MIERLLWYKNRLAAMSMAEIFHRAREAALRKIDGRNSKNLIAPLRDYGALPEIPELRAGMGIIPEALIAQWEQQALALQNADIAFFRQKWPPVARDIRWHLDPISNTSWPRDVFCFAIDYRHTEERGDIKYVWELNRLQYLQPIAALACIRKNTDLARFCLNEIESWIDNNPPFLGINWNSGIELALRIISILTVTSLVGEHLTREARSKIWTTLHTHARWIARYPSKYSSANNHRTAEGLGLLVIGALCPHFTEAATWKQAGWSMLCEAAECQILPDGAGAEQAVAYAASVLETLLTGLKIAETSNLTVPDFYKRKLAMGGEYLRWLMDADGATPHIGDDDNACVFGAYQKGDLYAASICACIAATTGRADLVPPQMHPHLRQAVFGIPSTVDFAPQGARCFTHGGMTIGRHRNPNGDIMLAFDHGGLGYLSIAAHGHADTLAIWLHRGNQPIFVDSGTYLYHAAHDQRYAFRSTSAHNSMVIENTDSSIMSGSFNWSHKATAILHSFGSHGDFWQCAAQHDGYEERFQTIHQRALNVSPASGAVIEDSIKAPAAHSVAIHFLLHPDLTARQEGKEIMILKGEHLLLRMRHESALETIIGLPASADGGFYSPEFGVKQTTTRIIFRGILSPQQKAITHLFWAA